VLRKGAAARRIERNLISGEVSLVIEEDGGDAENLDHGLVSGDTMREVWTIRPDDPLSARVTITYEQRLSRGNWSVRTLAETNLTSESGHLAFTARLQAWEGETPVFDRDFREFVKRDHL
jgi:hypothetical protein